MTTPTRDIEALCRGLRSVADSSVGATIGLADDVMDGDSLAELLREAALTIELLRQAATSTEPFSAPPPWETKS